METAVTEFLSSFEGHAFPLRPRGGSSATLMVRVWLSERFLDVAIPPALPHPEAIVDYLRLRWPNAIPIPFFLKREILT